MSPPWSWVPVWPPANLGAVSPRSAWSECSATVSAPVPTRAARFVSDRGRPLAAPSRPSRCRPPVVEKKPHCRRPRRLRPGLGVKWGEMTPTVFTSPPGDALTTIHRNVRNAAVRSLSTVVPRGTRRARPFQLDRNCATSLPLQAPAPISPRSCERMSVCCSPHFRHILLTVWPRVAGTS